MIKLTRKVKIIIGVAVFVLIMAAISWIVALALLDTDIKTEVYSTEFDYVDDTMYDNSYIAMRGGKWQLYRGGDAISRAFSYLEYEGDGLFSFISADGKGWGYVSTSGAVTAEFNQNFKPLLPDSATSVAVREENGTVAFKTTQSVQFKDKGNLLEYKEFAPFYRAYGDKYMAYIDEAGNYVAVNTATAEKVSLPFNPGDRLKAIKGFVTVGQSADSVTYDSALQRVAFLDGIEPAENKAQAVYFTSVDGQAVKYETGESHTAITLSRSSFTILNNLNPTVVKTDGRSAVVNGLNSYFWNGVSLNRLTQFLTENISGGEISVMSFASEASGGYVLDENFTLTRFARYETAEVLQTKEKNRAKYTLETRYLLGDGSLYRLEDGGLKAVLGGVVGITHDAENTESRIVARTAEGLAIFDSAFKQLKMTKEEGAEVFDPFLPAYVAPAPAGKRVILPRGEFIVPGDAVIELRRCTDRDNYFVTVTVPGSDEISVYAKNGDLIDKITLQGGENITLSQSQFIVYGPGGFNVVSKEKELKVDYEDVYFTVNNKYAVAVKGAALTVINLNDAAITDERVISGGVEMTEAGENTFVFRSRNTGLYGIIDGGKMTLSPTYRQMELHSDFLIVSVDSENTAGATYFQADFKGKRLGKSYYSLVSTDGLTMAQNTDLSIEIMNSRGRAILKNVTYVPVNQSGGFAFMKSKVYDEETGLTVDAERRDKSRLLVVTAGGYKRVISISDDVW